MKSRLRELCGAMTVLCVFLAGTAFAQDFSADIVSTSKVGTLAGKIFAAKDKIRVELPAGVTITRLDKGVVWVLISKGNMYLEQQLDPNGIASASKEIPGQTERTLEGKDVVDGRAADKYKVVYEFKGQKSDVFQWLDAASGIILKVASTDGSWSTEYRNIKLEPQPDSLFEIPPGYFKLPDVGTLGKLVK